MKRKIAIGATACLITCGIIVGSLLFGEDSPKEEIESSTTQIEQPTQFETATEPETDKTYFGLSEIEVNCIVDKLNASNVQCGGVSDFSDITCLGYGLIYTAPGVGNCDLNYDIIEYGVVLQDGCAYQVQIPSKVLEEHGVDVSERGANRKLNK